MVCDALQLCLGYNKHVFKLSQFIQQLFRDVQEIPYTLVNKSPLSTSDCTSDSLSPKTFGGPLEEGTEADPGRSAYLCAWVGMATTVAGIQLSLRLEIFRV